MLGALDGLGLGVGGHGLAVRGLSSLQSEEGHCSVATALPSIESLFGRSLATLQHLFEPDN